MFTRGDEQRAVKALSFTQAHIYLLYQQSGISLQIILGNDQEWSMVLQLAKTHQWTALKDFVSNKPLIKNRSGVSFNSLVLDCTSSTLIMITVQDYCHVYEALAAAKCRYFWYNP